MTGARSALITGDTLTDQDQQDLIAFMKLLD